MFYFAYGSNMYEAELKAWCPGALLVTVARLDGYRLAFNRCSEKRGCGVGDIVPDEGGIVWGTLYEIPDVEVPQLEAKEGAPAMYTLQAVPLTLPDGTSTEAMTFIGTSQETKLVLPNQAY